MSPARASTCTSSATTWCMSTSRGASSASSNATVASPGPGGDSEDDFDAFFASLGENVGPPPPVTTGRGMFDREVDFLREALREAFPDPSAPVSRGGVGWAEHKDENLVELVPPRDLQK